MNPLYRVIVVDDEPPARDLLAVFVARLSDLVCVTTCSNAMQALQAIDQYKPDLMFLDIQMPEMTGMDLMSLRLPHCPDIVLTTAYPEYALKSYDFSVLDYLVKPIAFDRFVQAVVKFREKRGHPVAASPKAEWATVDDLQHTVLATDTDATLDQKDQQSVWLREEKRLLQIRYSEVLFIEGLKDYVKVFLKDQMIMTHMNIGKAEELFRPPTFVRIHRSHIVRRAAIRLIDGNRVILTSGTELLIGPFYRDDLKKYISVLR